MLQMLQVILASLAKTDRCFNFARNTTYSLHCSCLFWLPGLPRHSGSRTLQSYHKVTKQRGAEYLSLKSPTFSNMVGLYKPPKVKG